MSTMKYLIIADNEIKAIADDNESAQLAARSCSEGRYNLAKVIYLTNQTVQGIWHKGERTL